MVAAMPTRPMPSALFCSEAMDGGAWRSAALSSIMLRGSFGGRLVAGGLAVSRLGRRAGLAALETLALDLRQVADARVLAELKGTDVGDDRPPVLRRHLRGVVRHLAEAARHHVEEVAGLLVAQARIVVRRRLLVAALDDHAVAVAGDAVARRAVDVEALAAAHDDVGRDRHRDLLDR